ncbi:hypothetical protein BPOR_0377g00020 [Botrytis porri]|uniref:Uncharacterized protein n=1 Tax=Botrytis porri TaxID=87229 RepID=A0A4Z1KHQ8_9HELO|nr:hypothetical protein BPOR_0377g00020 [Botrytis porri]
MFQRQEVLSDLTSQVSYDHSTRSLVIPNSGVEEKRDLPNALLRMPSMCPDESCSRTARGEALHSPLPSNLKIQTDKATISPEDVLPIIATFNPQNSRHQSTITNASSFLKKIFGPINHTLNIVPSSHISNPVQWTKFLSINLYTQPYIFPLSSPMQTYEQMVHFISQTTGKSPRATQGTVYPTTLRLSQNTDEYYYIGHFVVSSVVTTVDFNQVLRNLPEISPNDKNAKCKLLKERNRALGSMSELYVFFGEEQYKILVDAKEKGEAMKAADHTIGLLTEDYNRTKKSPTSTRTMNKASETNSLSEPHNPNVTPLDLKAPTAPKTMQSDHSTIEDQTLPTSTHRSFIHSSLSQAHDIPTEPAAMRGGHLSSESETSLESNQHDYIRSSLSQTIHIPKGPAAMMRSSRSSTTGTNISLVNGTPDQPAVKQRSYTTGDKVLPKMSNHHDIVSTPLTHLKDSHREIAILKGRHTSSDKSESSATPNCHQTTNSPSLQGRVTQKPCTAKENTLPMMRTEVFGNTQGALTKLLGLTLCKSRGLGTCDQLIVSALMDCKNRLEKAVLYLECVGVFCD